MDTDSFTVHAKTWYLQKYCKRCWNKIWTNYEIDRLLPMVKNKQVVESIKDELGGKIMKNIFGLRAKAYSYLKDNDDEY